MKPKTQAPPPAGGETQAPTDILMVVLLYAIFATLWILLSDQVVEWLFGGTTQLTLVSTLKGWLFVGVTSLLLYGLLRRLLGRASAAAAPAPNRRPILLSLVLLAVPITALTAVGIAYTLQQAKTREVARLQTITDLKTRQIADWLRERRGNARFVQTSRFWADLYHRWRDADDLAGRDLLQSRLNQYQENEDFQSILLLDERGEPLLDTTGGPLAIDPALRTAARQAAVDHQASRFGPYLDAAGRPRLDFVTPLPARDDRPSPVVVLRADPADYLFPTLQTWPVPSASGETLLFRRDGDQILYLNELRHRADTALKLRLPVTGSQLLAAQVARGEVALGDLIEGVDYRGVPALGVARAVPDTGWFLVAKLDQAELYAEATEQIAWIALTGLLALFGIAAGAVLFRQRQQLAASLREQAIQAEKQRALQLLDAIAQSSTDAIFAKDVEGRYLLFNREATRVTGKSAEAVLGRDDTAIFPPEQAALVRASDRQVMADNRAVTFQQDLVTVDGERTFLTTKGPLHDDAGQTIGLLGIARDITERQWAEAALKENNAFLNTLLDAIPVPVFYKNLAGHYLGFNQSFEEFYGTTRQELIGKGVFDIAPRELAEAYHAQDLELFRHSGTQRYESQVKDATGTVRDVVFHKATFADLDGHVRGLIGAILDITERKRNEAAVRGERGKIPHHPPQHWRRRDCDRHSGPGGPAQPDGRDSHRLVGRRGARQTPG